jgi:hypothetical protein
MKGKSNCGAGGKHSKVTVGKYAQGGKVEKTETMPSGAQQWVRGKTRADKMKTIAWSTTADGASRRFSKDAAKARSTMMNAFFDEDDKSRREHGDKTRR